MNIKKTKKKNKKKKTKLEQTINIKQYSHEFNSNTDKKAKLFAIQCQYIMYD